MRCSRRGAVWRGPARVYAYSTHSSMDADKSQYYYYKTKAPPPTTATAATTKRGAAWRMLAPLVLSEFTTDVVTSCPPDLVTESNTTVVGAGAAVVEP